MRSRETKTHRLVKRLILKTGSNHTYSYSELKVPREYDVWSEGYRATGEDAKAVHWGKYNAFSFDDAVRQAAEKHYPNKEERDYWISNQYGYWSIYGCRFFDNEADARKANG